MELNNEVIKNIDKILLESIDSEIEQVICSRYLQNKNFIPTFFDDDGCVYRFTEKVWYVSYLYNNLKYIALFISTKEENKTFIHSFFCKNGINSKVNEELNFIREISPNLEIFKSMKKAE